MPRAAPREPLVVDDQAVMTAAEEPMRDTSSDSPREPWSEGPLTDGGLQEGVDALKSICGYLERLGSRILVATLANFVLAVLFGVLLFSTPATNMRALAVGVSLVLTSGCIVLLTMFDRARRRGDAFFEDISEELQWRARQEVSAGRETRTPMPIRLALRRFNSASMLPLTPGQAGVGIYASGNVLITVTVIILRFSHG
jgi:hypothetical protein